MWKAMAVAAIALAFTGTASAQNPPPSGPDRGPAETRPLRGPADDPAGVRSQGGAKTDPNSTGTAGREQRSGAMPQRLGPIAPGTGARDRGPPDSSTYNPGASRVR